MSSLENDPIKGSLFREFGEPNKNDNSKNSPESPQKGSKQNSQIQPHQIKKQVRRRVSSALTAVPDDIKIPALRSRYIYRNSQTLSEFRLMDLIRTDYHQTVVATALRTYKIINPVFLQEIIDHALGDNTLIALVQFCPTLSNKQKEQIAQKIKRMSQFDSPLLIILRVATSANLDSTVAQMSTTLDKKIFHALSRQKEKTWATLQRLHKGLSQPRKPA